MDEEERYMRYVFPGLATVLVTGSALALVEPGLFRWAGWSSVAALLTVLVGSGGLGFLLAQAYFAFPWSRLDYGRWLFETKCYRECATDATRDLYKADWRRDPRRTWALGHHLWKTCVGLESGGLDKSTGRFASRMTAIGATLFGVTLGFFVWVVVVIRASVRGHTPCWFRLVVGILLFTLVIACLLIAFRSVRRILESIIRLGFLEHPKDQQTVHDCRARNRRHKRLLRKACGAGHDKQAAC